MAGVSRIQRDKRAQELIHELFSLGHTVREVKDYMDSLMPDDVMPFSHGAIGRERKNWSQVMARREEAAQAAAALTGAFKDCDEDTIARAATHMGNVLMLKMLNKTLDNEKIEINEQQAMFLAKGIHHLAVARKAELEASARAREEREANALDVTANNSPQGFEIQFVQPGDKVIAPVADTDTENEF